MQFWGQQCVLHAPVSCVVDGQLTPSYSANRNTLRVRDLVPELHATVQVSQLLQADISQSTGQWCVLHVCESVSTGHTCPPQADGLMTLRVAVW